MYLEKTNSDRLSVDCLLVMVILFSLSARICVFVSLDNSSLDDSAFSTDSNNEQASESSSAPESRADRPRPRPRPSKGESPPSTSSRSRSQNVPSYLHCSHIKRRYHYCVSLSYQSETSYHRNIMYQRMPHHHHHKQGDGITFCTFIAYRLCAACDG